MLRTQRRTIGANADNVFKAFFKNIFNGICETLPKGISMLTAGIFNDKRQSRLVRNGNGFINKSLCYGSILGDAFGWQELFANGFFQRRAREKKNGGLRS